MPRIPIVAANWKMYKGGPNEAAELAGGLLAPLGSLSQVECVLCPPFTALGVVAQVIRGSQIGLGAQNLYPEAQGAFTGEISGAFLKQMGCTYCILGHSERRTLFKEPDEFINRKVKSAIASGLRPILCCGETEAERDQGVTEQVVKRQLTKGLEGVPAEQARQIVITYEPIWAIGTGRTAKAEDAEAVHRFIRSLLAELYSADLAEGTRIQYGGSVKPENAKELFAQPNIDGGLIGGASLKVDSFSAIVKAAVR